ncbi:MAG: amidohydrolase [Deltaproteobacteria bacterium]|nr:amidohydrolase [Deltaproteobacteria bacterium]
MTWIQRPPLLAVLALLLPSVGLAATPKKDAPEGHEALESVDEAEERGLRAVETRDQSPSPLVVLDGGTVMTADGEVFAPGYVVLSEGIIQQVGQGPAPSVEGAQVLDVKGQFVTPGLIDTHSHLGVYSAPSARAHSDGNEATAATTPGVWAEHAFSPQDPGIQRAVAGGVTAMQVLPGSANLIGGRGVVLSMVPHRGSRAMRFPDAPETIKMACGENPKRVYGGRGTAPSTRMGNLRGTRAAFLKAERLLARLEAHAEAGGKKKKGKKKKGKKNRVAAGDVDSGGAAWNRDKDAPDRDLNLETLVGVLRGEILPQVHCYRAYDMLAMMQLADEFDFRIRSFHHALDAYKIRDVLAEHEVASSTWADWWGFKVEAYDGIPENAALLTEAGARAIIHSDSARGIQRLNQEAGKAYYSGLAAGIDLTEDDALAWITKHPAWALGIDGATGTLAPDKRADVVVWDGHPFSVYTRARLVFIEGVLRYDVDRPQTWSDFAVGQEVTP